MIRGVILLLLLLCPTAWAGQGMGPGPGVKGYASAGPSYLLTEDGTGTGWTNSAGVTWNTDATSLGMDSSAVFIQSLTDVTARTSYKTVTTSGEVWAYSKFYISSQNITSGAYKTIITLNNSGTIVASANIYNLSSTLRVLASCGGAVVYTTDAVVEDALYHVLLHYKKGTGTDAICDVEFSTDGTFAGSGSKYAQKTTGTSTGDVNRIILAPAYTSSSGLDVYYDKIRVDDVAIGSNPE